MPSLMGVETLGARADAPVKTGLAPPTSAGTLRSARCTQCGLTQLAGAQCKACGQPFNGGQAATIPSPMPHPAPTGTGPSAEPVHTAPDRLRAGRAFLILGTFFGTQIVVGLLIGVGAGFYRGLQGRADAPAGVPPAIVAQIAGVLLGALVAFHLARQTLSAVSGRRPLARIGWSLGSRRALLMATLSGFLLSAFFLMFVIPLFPPRIDRALGPLAQAATTAGWPRHAWAIFAVLLAPPIEEFFFRGVLFTGISRSGGRVLSMVAVSLIFVALHVPEASAYWPALIAIGLVALSTMVVRIVADSLGPAIALHAAYNSGLVLTVYCAAARL